MSDHSSIPEIPPWVPTVLTTLLVAGWGYLIRARKTFEEQFLKITVYRGDKKATNERITALESDIADTRGMVHDIYFHLLGSKYVPPHRGNGRERHKSTSEDGPQT